jgi:hypothetical protein
VDQRRDPGQPGAHHRRRRRVAAHADDDVDALLLDQPRRPDAGADELRHHLQRALHAAQAHHVEGVQLVAVLRHQGELQPALGADEADLDVAVGDRLERFGHRQPRVDVATGAAGTDGDAQLPAFRTHSGGSMP